MGGGRESMTLFQNHCSEQDRFDITLSLNSEAQVNTANYNKWKSHFQLLLVDILDFIILKLRASQNVEFVDYFVIPFSWQNQRLNCFGSYSGSQTQSGATGARWHVLRFLFMFQSSIFEEGIRRVTSNADKIIYSSWLEDITEDSKMKVCAAGGACSTLSRQSWCYYELCACSETPSA